MDFTLTSEQAMLQDGVRRYLEKTYDFEKRRVLVHQQGGFSAAHWRSFAELGWLGAALPESHGGFGGGAIEAAIILEEFGRALVVEPFLAVGVLAAQTLLAVPGAQAARLVAEIASGEARPILAHSEAGAGGVLEHVETRATPAGGGWRLDGHKTLVLGGPFADRFIISARTSGGAGDAGGISLFLVERGAPGLSQQDFRLADGSRASELRLAGVEVAAEFLLGPEGGAHGALQAGHAHAIVGLAADAVGAMEAALWMTRDYLRTRKQFGVAIGSFQALQHRMADMLIELELARAMLHRGLAHLDQDAATRARAVAATKVQIARSGRFVCGQAIQLHGGIGVTEEYAVGHYFKRLTVADALFGNASLHLAGLAVSA